MLGELLFEGSRALFSELGSHILFLFLMLGGTLLVTGASIAGVVTATRRHVSTTTQRVRRQAERTAVLARDVAPTESPAPPEPVASSRWSMPRMSRRRRLMPSRVSLICSPKKRRRRTEASGLRPQDEEARASGRGARCGR